MSKQIKNPLVFKIAVTERQLKIIQAALDFFNRILMGQFGAALWQVFISRDLEHYSFHAKCDELKMMIFPELHLNGYYGVGWKAGDSRQEQLQISYEIEGMIRHELWRRREDRTPYVTSSSPPLQYSPEPFIKLEDINQNNGWTVGEFPTEFGRYNVTDSDGAVTTLDFVRGGWETIDEGVTYEDKIVAFQKVPDPYIGEKK